MRIEVTQPIAAGPERVFDYFADFDMFEARARRRGWQVRRMSQDPPEWLVRAEWHRLSHDVRIAVEGTTRCSGYRAVATTTGIAGTMEMQIAPDAAGCNVRLVINLSGVGLKGRILLKSLTLARHTLEGRLGRLLSRLATEVETGGAA